MNGWNSSYQDSDAYQDSSYGYDGYYVDLSSINTTSVRALSAVEDGYGSRNQWAPTQTAPTAFSAMS